MDQTCIAAVAFLLASLTQPFVVISAEKATDTDLPDEVLSVNVGEKSWRWAIGKCSALVGMFPR